MCMYISRHVGVIVFFQIVYGVFRHGHLRMHALRTCVVFVFVFLFFFYIRTSHHPVVLSRFLFVIFLAHVFSFSLVERSGLKQTTHCCRLTTRVSVKCLFLALSAVIQPGVKSNQGSCKEKSNTAQAKFSCPLNQTTKLKQS